MCWAAAPCIPLQTTCLRRSPIEPFPPVRRAVTGETRFSVQGKLIKANLLSFLRNRMLGGTCWRSVLQREMLLIIFTHLIWEVHGNLIITIITRSSVLTILILPAWYVFQGATWASSFSWSLSRWCSAWFKPSLRWLDGENGALETGRLYDLGKGMSPFSAFVSSSIEWAPVSTL